jgi:hypothetical protein
MENQFIQLCKDGDLVKAQECYQLNPTIDISEEVFCWTCYNGHLEVAQWLFQISKKKEQPINISAFNEHAFCHACRYGHLELAQWLFQVSKEKGQPINISVNNEEAFRWACMKGHLHVAQWLLQIKPDIDISAYNFQAFRNACYNTHLEVSQWLWLFLRTTIDIQMIEQHFRFACQYGDLEIAQWLYQISKEKGQDINISDFEEYAFRRSCQYGHLHVAQWIQSLKPYLYVIYYDENGKIKDYYIRTKEEANWEKRKYLVWLASNHCPEKNKHNLLYKLPSDVSRMVIGFV